MFQLVLIEVSAEVLTLVFSVIVAITSRSAIDLVARSSASEIKVRLPCAETSRTSLNSVFQASVNLTITQLQWLSLNISSQQALHQIKSQCSTTSTRVPSLLWSDRWNYCHAKSSWIQWSLADSTVKNCQTRTLPIPLCTNSTSPPIFGSLYLTTQLQSSLAVWMLWKTLPKMLQRSWVLSKLSTTRPVKPVSPSSWLKLSRELHAFEIKELQ